MVRTKQIAKKSLIPNRNIQPNTTDITSDRSIRIVRRFKPASTNINQLKKHQSSRPGVIRRLPFEKIVTRILKELRRECRLHQYALTLLQQAAEQYIIGLFEDTYLCATSAKRTRVMVRDWQLAKRIRGDKL